MEQSEDYLYKFRSFPKEGEAEHSLEIITKSEIFFAKTSLLNDPFELEAIYSFGENNFDRSFANTIANKVGSQLTRKVHEDLLNLLFLKTI